MQDHVGEIYDGVISSVTNFGFFVRLDDLFIDGLVHVSSLENDYYIYDATRNRLIGENTRFSYRLGDKVKIKVEAVNPEERKIDFSLVDSNNKPRRQGKTEKDRNKKQRTAPKLDQDKPIKKKRKRSENKPLKGKKSTKQSVKKRRK